MSNQAKSVPDEEALIAALREATANRDAEEARRIVDSLPVLAEHPDEAEVTAVFYTEPDPAPESE